MAAAARARWRLLALPLALLLATGSPRGLDAAPKPPVPKAISVSPPTPSAAPRDQLAVRPRRGAQAPRPQGHLRIGRDGGMVHSVLGDGEARGRADAVGGSALHDLREAIVKGLGFRSELTEGVLPNRS
ncbi:uncharacterized protein LOC123407006 [Hordeum vulgare subsp. vulgare]|uniref:uncharacterized protein LOC123407006 n=1 Tax=Hordeum vulgare subsp. vulgare TaxID=112509 RepID=UPI00162DA694|nr:uncharacterized protein LOC123407006 [Hordeum vulgare subsp. vulgare]